MPNIQPITALKNKYVGQTAYIVGKGASLEHLRTEHFKKAGPIIALHEAIVKVEELPPMPLSPIFSMQKDRYMAPVKTATLIVHKHESAKDGFPEYIHRYEFDNPADFNIPENFTSIITALNIAWLMGCRDIYFVSCDAYVMGDFRRWTPEGIKEEKLDYDETGEVVEVNTYENISWGLNAYLAMTKTVPRWITPRPVVPDNAPVKLIIATPFYEMKGFSPYIKSLLSMCHLLTDLGVQYEFWNHEGDSYVDRARNTLLARFMASDATDLLFIDSDESWDFMDNQAALNIIASPYELTGAAYPTKNQWEHYSVNLDDAGEGYQVICPDTGMLRGTRCAAGFMRIKRSCIEKLQDAYPESQYMDSPYKRPLLVHELFQTQVKYRRLFGEDYSFCDKWTDIGGKVWIEPRIKFGHYGIQGFYGNYHDFLRQQPGGDLYKGNEVKHDPT